jgi:hypothetical protein
VRFRHAFHRDNGWRQDADVTCGDSLLHLCKFTGRIKVRSAYLRSGHQNAALAASRLAEHKN